LIPVSAQRAAAAAGCDFIISERQRMALSPWLALPDRTIWTNQLHKPGSQGVYWENWTPGFTARVAFGKMGIVIISDPNEESVK
jgi:hypothetical protein